MLDHRGRNYFPAAQGCRRWFRTINGRMVMFTAVVDGWWGVGPTGTITMHHRISNGDWYPTRRQAWTVIQHRNVKATERLRQLTGAWA